MSQWLSVMAVARIVGYLAIYNYVNLQQYANLMVLIRIIKINQLLLK